MDSNVLFLKYEDMHRDLVTMVEQLARFLGVSCDKAQLESLIEHCHQLVDQCCNAEALPVGRGWEEPSMVVGGSGYGRGLLWVVSEAGRVAAGITSVRGEACVGWVHDSVRDLMHKMSILPDWHSLYPKTQKLKGSRPHSSPCRGRSKTGSQDLCRPSSSATAIVNPMLTFLDIERILSQKISSRRDEMKKIFQVLDPTHSQTVTKGELKRVIVAFLLPLTKEQFQELLSQIFQNMKTIKKVFQLIDVNSTGMVQSQELRRVLETFCLKMKDEEYEMFLKKYYISGAAVVDYNDFLKNVISITNDLTFRQLSSSPELSRDSQQARTPRRDRQFNSMSSEDVWKNYTLDDVEKTFCQETPNGHMTWDEFRHILNCMVVKLNDSEFQELKHTFDPEGSGSVKVSSLLEAVDDSPKDQLSEQLQNEEQGQPDLAERMHGEQATPCQLVESSVPTCDFRTQSMRDKMTDTTIEEVIDKLKQFIQEQDPVFKKHFLSISQQPDAKIGLEDFRKDPYSAFFKVDTDMDGLINMNDLHKLLQQLQLYMKDSEYERFLGLLGLRLSLTLNFREFENLCEQKPWKSDEAPQRLIRYKQRVADSELACEQAHQYLMVKAKTRWADLSKNFIETDNEGNGILRRRDIKNALYGFDIPLTPREFEKLWQNYDIEGRGYITYQEFLQRLGIRYSSKTHRPYKEDYFNFLGHFTKPKQIQEEMQELQQTIDREKLMDHYEEISKSLNMLEKSKTGAVSLCKVQKVLQDCGYPLKEEELIYLLKSLSISVHNNCIDPLDFLRALETNKTSKAPPKEKEKEESIPPPINFSKLNPEEVVKRVQVVVDASQPALFKTADEWAEKMPKVLAPTAPKEMANRDILTRVHKAVASHYHVIAQEFENFDTTKSNTVSRDEFRSVCTRHVQILTDEQFDRLWGEMPVNAKGRLKYQDFLSRFSTDREPSPPMAAGDSGDSTMAQRGSSAPDVSQATRSTLCSPPRDSKAGLKSRSHPCTPVGTPPLQNCEPIESKLRKQIQGCWRELLKECKEKDSDKQGSITAAEFLAIVEKFKLDISKEESQQLIVKYDLKDNGKFAYCDFIQSCVLLLKAKETSLMRRMRIQNADKMKEAGAETQSFYSALLRIQPKIVHCWRPMRRTFKAYDENGTGLLSVADFRKVLRQYSINLSEEEFFHVLEYYDKSLSSKISYNDFLRAFLQ
ncbi:EF-hand calcium binding domain 6 [Cricetulus griseus]